MAKKKKSKKKPGKKNTAIKRATRKSSAGKVVKVAAKKPAANKAAPKKSVARKRPAKKKAAERKTRSGSASEGQIRRDDRNVDTQVSLNDSRTRSGGQSGDLQGLSDVDQADSESVDELLEEGNAFEADVVAGVQEAGNSDGREVHTREVPEDDVPGEYLDEE
jgi:hypothetical protein